MIERLDGFFGAVDRTINQRIGSQIRGRKVLDIGCGFGSLVEFLRADGKDVVGIDPIDFCISAGRTKFPQADLRVADLIGAQFPDDAFDCVTLKDVFHHLYGEDDVNVLLREISRIARQIVIVDPNPTWILLTARKFIGHVDPVCSSEDACRVLKENGFRLSKISFSELIAFPFSGGYVGRELLPRRKWLFEPVLFLDRMILGMTKFLGISKHLAWRYLIVAERIS